MCERAKCKVSSFARVAKYINPKSKIIVPIFHCIKIQVLPVDLAFLRKKKESIT